MTTTSPAAKLHPVLWIAAVSVTALSIAGIAAIGGWIPSRAEPVSAPPAAVAAAPAAVTTVASPAPAAAVAPPPAAAASEVPVAKKVHVTPKPKPAVVADAGPMGALPPPGTGVPPDYVAPAAATPPAPPVCHNCGVVDTIREVKHEGQGSGVGAIAGGVLGGLLGNNIGHGNGRALATVAGAVGGGLLGNKVEKSQNQSVSYQITLRMEDGSSQLFDSANMPAWRIGDQVKVVNGAIVAR
jgi:outer membrane lipoprotein SlyB